ncbi:MAG: AMP-binding protein [Pararhodobacter sp.]|nr:AMP-binding protein [Pararhodobacter sp.]
MWIDQIATGHDPERCAIIDHDGAQLSFGALEHTVQETADRLHAQGVGPGDRVLVVAENCALFVTLLLATARLRAWAVPVNARVSADELAQIAAHADPRACVFTTHASEAAQTHAGAMGATVQGAVAGGPLVMTSHATARAEPADRTPETQVAAMLYTSGTTGQPKGVMLTHANLDFNAMMAARMRAMTPSDEMLVVLPGTHVMALSTAILAALRAGARLRLVPRFTPQAVLEALAGGVSIMPAVPAMYDQILRHLDQTGAALNAPRLRLIGTGGAPLDPGWKARIEGRFGLVLNNGYGLTEAGPGISSTSLGPPRRDSSVGHVYPDCTIRIDMPAADGVGELLVRGPNVMKGYYRNPEATAQAIDAEGFLRTGDLARLDGDGALHIVGRNKELIIRSGFNIYPPEVEAALSGCPGVVQVAVVGRAVPGNEEVIAFAITDGTVTPEALRERARARLAGYKVPQHVLIVADMPMTAAGKVRKNALLARHAAELPAP